MLKDLKEYQKHVKNNKLFSTGDFFYDTSKLWEIAEILMKKKQYQDLDKQYDIAKKYLEGKTENATFAIDALKELSKALDIGMDLLKHYISLHVYYRQWFTGNGLKGLVAGALVDFYDPKQGIFETDLGIHKEHVLPHDNKILPIFPNF